MDWLHLLNKLEQFCHIDWKSSNQSISIPHVKHVQPKATPTIVRHGIIYPQSTWPITSIFGPSEQSQVSHHKPVLGGNQGVRTMTYSYCHQMGHLFNCCPFYDDRLRQLFREEVMNIHQHVFPTTIIAIPNLSILGTQTMNPSIGHMVIHVNKQHGHNMLHQLY
jgi:hypothetical protein